MRNLDLITVLLCGMIFDISVFGIVINGKKMDCAKKYNVYQCKISFAPVK